MIFLSLEAVTLPIFKTGQTQSYDANGTVVTDNSVKDDGYYQTGVRQRYTRDNDIVTDEVTGLEWQDDSNLSNSENKKNWTEADSYCSSFSLGSNDNWRLPTKEELESIVDRGKSYPALSEDFKNVSLAGLYWSSTAFTNTGAMWYINFYSGSSYSFSKSHDLYVRCVRGEQFDNLILSPDIVAEVVTDSVTNLQWQDNTNVTLNDRNWTAAIEYCESLDMAGQTDWRLPNENELSSIVGTSASNPAINNAFSHSSSDHYWSSTTCDNGKDRAWNVHFYYGYSHSSVKSDNGYVRCVRGGEVKNKTTMAPIIMYLLN